MIEEVTHYVKIVRSYAIVSLRFLMSLKVIHGKQLYNDRWVCMDSSGATRWLRCAAVHARSLANVVVCLVVATRPTVHVCGTLQRLSHAARLFHQLIF